MSHSRKLLPEACHHIHMTTWCLQVQLHLRAISADEYDDAVRWAPSSCPLFAMGDRRSGRELLEQADADAVRPRWPRFPPYPITMARGAQAACAWSPPPIQRQREFLLQQRGLAHLPQQHAPSVEQQGQHAVDASYRAALIGVPSLQPQQHCAESGLAPGASLGRAPRELEQPPSALPFALAEYPTQHPAASPSTLWTASASATEAAGPCSSPPLQCSARVWGRGPLAHYWALGYRHADLDALFAALPDTLRALLRRAAAAAAVCDELRRGALRAADPLGAADGLGAGGGESGEGGPLREPGELWEAEEEAGFLSVSLDPATGRRRGVAMNRRHAELMGAAGREELVGLVLRDEVGLGVPEADLVACLAHELANAAEARTELYLRVVRGAGAGAAGAGARRERAGGGLVHCLKVKEFDGLGRVARVRLPLGLPSH